MGGFEQSGGLFHVRYEAPEELRPERQEALLRAVRLHSARLPAGLLFELAAGVATIDAAVPKFWLETLDDPTVRVVAMAIMSDAVAVRMAADAFNIANILRRKPVAVKSFLSGELVAAQTWLVEQIHLSADAP